MAKLLFMSSFPSFQYAKGGEKGEKRKTGRKTGEKLGKNWAKVARENEYIFAICSQIKSHSHQWIDEKLSPCVLECRVEARPGWVGLVKQQLRGPAQIAVSLSSLAVSSTWWCLAKRCVEFQVVAQWWNYNISKLIATTLDAVCVGQYKCLRRRADRLSLLPSRMKNKQHGKVGNCVSVCAAAAFKRAKKREREKIERETQLKIKQFQEVRNEMKWNEIHQ